MKTYLLNIKSHCEYPDYENEVRADSLKQALDLFYSTALAQAGWQKIDLLEHICEDTPDGRFISEEDRLFYRRNVPQEAKQWHEENEENKITGN